MPQNFHREISVQIGDMYIDSLDIDFEISSEVVDEGTSATASISIWNLSPKSAARVKEGQQVKLRAGYMKDSGIIYLGRVISATTEISGADRELKVMCKDYTYPQNLPPRTHPKGTRISTILTQLYADCALPVGHTVEDFGVTLTAAHTTLPDALAEIELLVAMINGDPDTEIRVHHVILGGSACVVAENSAASEAHLLAASTGLIETAPDSSDTCDRSASLLLNWRIHADSLVYLQAADVTGYYRVAGCKHIHDGDEYKTEITLSEVAAA